MKTNALLHQAHELSETFLRRLHGIINPRGSYNASQFKVTLFVVGLFALYVLYSFIMFKFLPELGPKLVIAGCAGLALVWLGPKVTFPLYFATWFSAAIPAVVVPISLNRALAALFVASWMAHLVRYPPRIPRFSPVVILTLLTLYGVTLNIVMKDADSPASIQQVVYLFIGLAVFSVYRTKADLVGLLWSFLAITTVLTSVGILEFILRTELFPQLSDTTITDDNVRINGISRNAIQYAFNATWMIPGALFLHLQTERKWVRTLSMLLIIFLIICCLLTFNRQTPIILGAMIFGGILLIRYKYRTRLLVLFFLITACVTPFVVGKILERYNNIGAGRPDVSIAVRYDKLMVAKEILKDHWLLGIGINNFQDYWFEYKPKGGLYQIHTDPEHEYYIDLGYVQILTETGIVGTLGFALLIGISFWIWLRAYRASRRDTDPLATNLLAFIAMNFIQLLISMLIQDTFYTPHTYLLFFLFFIVLTLLQEQKKIQQSGELVA